MVNPIGTPTSSRSDPAMDWVDAYVAEWESKGRPSYAKWCDPKNVPSDPRYESMVRGDDGERRFKEK